MEKEINIELRVLQYNINSGYNEDVKRKCPTLFQYMQYVDILREYLKEYTLDEAVILAVEYCIANDILRDFLLANKSEVVSMSIFEYDEELHIKTLKEEFFEEGYQKGLAESQEVITEKQKALAKKQKILEEKQEALAQKDAEIERLKKLLEERNKD